MRPAFCVWGYVAAAGIPTDFELKPLLAAAGSLDVLHVSALVHDDLMDSSDLRRGRPAAHRQFEALHANAGWLGDSAAFGKAGAILLGDLLVMWSAQMLQAPAWTQSALERALPIVEAMRTEVTCGQYLDMVAQAHPLRQRAPAIGSLRPTIELALGRGQSGGGVQGRALHRAAAVSDRRRTGWRRRSSCTLRSARTVHRSAGPSSSATTCSGSSATRRSPASRPEMIFVRASARCWSPTRTPTPATRVRSCCCSASAIPALTTTGISRAAAGDHRVGCPGRGGIDDQREPRASSEGLARQRR